MRKLPFWGLCAGPVSFVLAFLAVAQPVHAQGLIESFFGLFGGSNKPARPQAVPRPSPASVPGFGGERQSNPFSGRRPAQAPASFGGRYKTMCVRLCDGFYFPISNGASRRQFYEDAEQCQQRCGSETRLFYMSPQAGSIDTARDVTGMAYGKLETAFLYRKKLSKSCSCRPEPWSVSERMRHRRYAMAELQDDAVAEAGGAKPETTAADARPTELAAVPLPVPVSRPASEAADTDKTATQTEVVEARDEAPSGPLIAPAPRAARIAKPVGNVAPRPRRARPMQQQSWGLGASGLPAAKYKPRWPGDP